MLADICGSLVNVDPDELDAVIDGSLRSIVEFLGVDRSSLIELTPTGRLQGTHSWARPPCAPATLFAPLEGFDYYTSHVSRGHMFVMSRVDELPPGARSEREYCIANGIRSHVGVPLMVGGEFLGVMGFAFLRQENPWSQDMLGRLRLVGEAFANAMLRRAWGRQQLRLQDELQRRVEERTAMLERRTTQLRRLAMELTQISQRERRRVAQVLHEGLAQALVGARMLLGAQHQATQNDRLRGVLTMIDDAIGVARSLTAELHPPVLSSLGLAAAMQWLRTQSRDIYDLDVSVDVRLGDEPPLEVRELLFDAARELLRNVAQHAGVDAAWLVLERQNGRRLRLAVRDRGKGFDPAAMDCAMASGLGLLALRERLESLGGTMRIDSRPGQGCTVEATVPAHPPAGRDSRPSEGP